MGLYVQHEYINGVDIQSLFAKSFNLSWIALLPAIIIFAMSLLRINVKTAMLASILTAIVICMTYQNMDLMKILNLLVFGFHASDPQIAAMINGGGIVSMLKVAAIVCLSSSYAGIFEGTGLLDNLKDKIINLSKKTSVYRTVLCTSIFTALVACNQTLTIMLTHQLCSSIETDQQQFAIDLENTAVIIAPLIPWSIAGSVPLATVSAPTACLLAACYLYLLPLWRLIVQSSLIQKECVKQ